VVDIGIGKPAVLHISQIIPPDPNQPIKRVDEVLKEGETVDVWVKRISKEGRVELTMVKPLDLEWRDIHKEMIVKGNVVRLEKFGAFVEIGAERPGLIHISEMAHGYVRTPGDILKEGDEVEAQVIDFNRRKKQIKLSLKALQPEPVKEEEPVFVPELPKKEKPPRRPKKAKSARSRGEDTINVDELLTSLGEQAPAESEPTSMELALRAAMERAKTRKQQTDKSRHKGGSDVQEAILARTLENKV
jgi:predicted RNA-binding protein with RPS1 domain